MVSAEWSHCDRKIEAILHECIMMSFIVMAVMKPIDDNADRRLEQIVARTGCE